MAGHIKVGSGRPLFIITDFRVWAAVGAPRLTLQVRK